jgi:hypothetical protein
MKLPLAPTRQNRIYALELRHGNNAIPNERHIMTKASKAPKAPKASPVVITIPTVNAAWTSLVLATKKSDTAAEIAVTKFAKLVTSRKVDIRSARKSVEELGTKSPVLLTSQIEALPTYLQLMAKGAGFEDFHALTTKEKLTKATAAYKLGVGIAEQFPTYDALKKEIKDFNARKNAGKSKESPKSSKKAVSIETALKSMISLVEGLGDGIEDDVYDLLIELNKVTAEKVGITA